MSAVQLHLAPCDGLGLDARIAFGRVSVTFLVGRGGVVAGNMSVMEGAGVNRRVRPAEAASRRAAAERHAYAARKRWQHTEALASELARSLERSLTRAAQRSGLSRDR